MQLIDDFGLQFNRKNAGSRADEASEPLRHSQSQLAAMAEEQKSKVRDDNDDDDD